MVSDLNPDTYIDDLEIIRGPCDICNREDVTVTRHRFREPEKKVDYKTLDIVDNPNALSIAVCGTDINLIAKFKRESGRELTPHQLVELARKYRKANPIRNRD